MDDSTLLLWDVATGRQIRVLEGHKDWVSGVAWSRDGKLIVSSSGDGTARMWEVDAKVHFFVCLTYI